MSVLDSSMCGLDNIIKMFIEFDKKKVERKKNRNANNNEKNGNKNCKTRDRGRL